MRGNTRLRSVLGLLFLCGLVAASVLVRAQTPATGQVVAVRAGRLFDPKSGANLANQVVLISDYPGVAAYKKEEEAAYVDAEFMKAWRSGAQFVVQGSGHVEFLEPAPHLV